ncbi:MAG: heme ABC exporter ATP-binding protein CcmA [Pseudomonadota bacterium]
MTTPLLSLTSVACMRGGLTVLQDVTFTLGAGQATILRGPNGSGKTTLLRTIAGLQPSSEGQVSAAPESIAYAAHADGIKGPLTVAENLEFWAGLFGTSGIDAALTGFDLVALRHRRAQALSAGQKRRLGLARLLVTGRPIWALDEPTVSLDKAAVALFAGVVEAHLAEGGAALIATHIDLGLKAETLDISAFAPTRRDVQAFDESFL